MFSALRSFNDKNLISKCNETCKWKCNKHETESDKNDSIISLQKCLRNEQLLTKYEKALFPSNDDSIWLKNLITSTLWRFPGFYRVILFVIMGCSSLQVVSVAVHCGPEKLFKQWRSLLNKSWKRQKKYFNDLKGKKNQDEQVGLECKGTSLVKCWKCKQNIQFKAEIDKPHSILTFS